MAGRNRRLKILRPAGLAAVVAWSLAGCSGSSAVSGDQDPLGDVYRVEIEACAGINKQRATAMTVADGLVATAAHSLETARGAVLRNAAGAEVAAEVVYLDPDRDIALLAIEPSGNNVFVLAQADEGAAVTIRTYASPDGIEIKDGTVLRLVSATLDGVGRRQALELAVVIDLGDSGAPVIDGDGNAVGMVFASSRNGDRGWAVAAGELETALADYGDPSDPEPINRCKSEPLPDP